MTKAYTFDEFKWKFLSEEVERFDLRRPYDLGRYMARQSLRKDDLNEKEIRKGKIVRILQIKYFTDEPFSRLKNIT